LEGNLKQHLPIQFARKSVHISLPLFGGCALKGAIDFGVLGIESPLINPRGRDFIAQWHEILAINLIKLE